MTQQANLYLWESHVRSLRRVALDTNSIIYTLDGTEPHASLVRSLLARAVRGELSITLSVIVEAELLVRPLRTHNARMLDGVEIFLRETPGLSVYPAERRVARRAAEIRARTRLAMPDAIIAATALDQRCDAIVGNDILMSTRLQEPPYLVLDDYA